MEHCKGYCGAACVNGMCPKAIEEEFAERGMETPYDCNECWFYKGCEDCAFEETPYCYYYEKDINE